MKSIVQGLSISFKCIFHIIVLMLCMTGGAWAGDRAPDEWENVIGPEGMEWAKKTLNEQNATTITSFEDVPPRQYMRMEIPKAEVPAASGQYYDTLAPDTADLAERARLVVHFFAEQSIPDADHEPTCHVVFGATPPRAGINAGGGCIWPKFMEALPLMRIMSGSTQGLEVDRDWAEVILHSIGPDGLSYWPLVGRPWDTPGAYGTKDVGPYRGWFHMNVGRLLGAVSIYYQQTGDPIWLETGKGIVDGLDELVVKIDDKAVSFDWYYAPAYKLPENAQQKAREYLNDVASKEPVANITWNQILYTTWVVTGLSQFYQVSKYEPALDMAYRLARVIRLQYPDDGHWYGHHHANCLAIHAFCELALAANDAEYAEFAKKMYEWAKRNKETGAIPSMGYFPCGQDGDPNTTSETASCKVMEPCSIGDMTAIAVKLTELGVGDYYDDIDAYVRNGLLESQVTAPHQIDEVIAEYERRGQAPESPASYNYLTDRLADRYVGFFSITASANDLYYHPWAEMCCTGNCSRALYYAWESVLDYSEGELEVNLLLNRASPWADVASYLPYTGQVDIAMKQDARLKVRINEWIDKSMVGCRVDGKQTDFTWDGNYVVFCELKENQVATILFPIAERTEDFETNGLKYRVTFRGADVVAIDPPDSGYVGLYQREHYRYDESRYFKLTRFVSDHPIRW